MGAVIKKLLLATLIAASRLETLFTEASMMATVEQRSPDVCDATRSGFQYASGSTTRACFLHCQSMHCTLTQ
jgi:hypothetical protein